MMTPSQWSQLRYFKPDEFNRPDLMSFDLLRMLDKARHLAGLPFIITSSYRDDPGTSAMSEHREGRAVDIRVKYEWERFLIVKACLDAGFLRIGVYDRHIHVDVSVWKAPKSLWVGVSK